VYGCQTACVIDWGSVPDWISGIGTTGALLATLYIVTTDRKDADSRQARQVAVIHVPHLSISQDRAETGVPIQYQPGDFVGTDVRIRNGSSASISEAMVGVRSRVGTGQERRGIRFLRDGTWDVVEPGQTAQSQFVDFAGRDFPDVDVFVTFKDVEGRTWRVGIADRRPERYNLGDIPASRLRRLARALKLAKK
jgi:hypothetical protein